MPDMRNPWRDVPLDQYEKHMAEQKIYQLQELNRLMERQLNGYDVHSVAILGVAGGNGLEHIAAGQYKTIVGVDINENYLNTCWRRYPQLQSCLQLLCVDLRQSEISLPQVDLVVADLILEYIGMGAFFHCLAVVKPEIVSCVVQQNQKEAFVSPSPYSQGLQKVEDIHQDIDPAELVALMKGSGWSVILREEIPMPNGKRLIRLDFRLKLQE